MSPSHFTLTREQLYAEVWAEPAVAVAQRHGVSSNYLARVCEHMNVPCPPRGYWAKERVGRAPSRPPLPDPRPGEVLTWAKGDSVPRGIKEAVRTNTDDASPVRRDLRGARSDRHPLVAGVREFFEAARVSDEGYLRPSKRNVLDLLTTRDTLTYSLETVNRLLQALEDRGHRATLSSDARFYRPEFALYDGQVFDDQNRELWRPGRLTIVSVGETDFGLSFCEFSEEAEVSYNWDNPVRYQKVVEEPSPKRRHTRHTRDRLAYKRQMPCGRLALRAYAPYVGVTWETYWRERELGDLAKKSGEILAALEAAIPSIASLRAEAQEKAERRRRQWEVDCRERQRREREQRRADAHRESHQHLLTIVENWALARNIERFFQYAARRARQLPPEAQTHLVERLRVAREVFADVNPLSHFDAWRSPSELLAPEDRDDAASDTPGEGGEVT